MALPEAERRVRGALAGLGLTPEVLFLAGDGESPGDAELPRDAESAGDDRLCAAVCQVRTADGTLLPSARGMGKGRYDEARVGALFEALEHHVTGPDGFDAACVAMEETAHLAAGPLADEPWLLALADMSRTAGAAETTASTSRAVSGGGRVACCRYRPVGVGDGVAVPLFVSCPWYVETGAAGLRERVGDFCDYGRLMRYSCNSGSAIGVTADEALLHALNETVERDALSLVLVRAFLGRGRFRPAVVDAATLPSDLARGLARAERLAGGPVWLVDVTADLGVPVMLAYVAPDGGRPHRRGSGASASPAHAARRAVAELVQTVAAESLSWSARRGDLRGLARHPELHACGRFDLTAHLRDARTVPLGREPAPAHPRDRVRELVATLAAHGRTPYYRTVAVLPGEITVVHVVVPGLERFMLITDGNLMVPGARGRAAAANGAAARANGGPACRLMPENCRTYGQT
ncbi:hypothetical protein Skr01_31180 [Sphaerisporangium krabiense]|uniref:Ribosomal protein S12 methylthiotransferase accessory factor n=1 Tax=Sphaerisporangium krabiense TaxID=763782 RepID=A0A7W8Z1V6_9ACTN|nr:YcaO-like family protein [Sphaerisporangium krabiense]MBB5625633.1 ribosomal protein S12 methylthiotransferase accessory factor [Sphaerisporangium krabiense]GII63033.1 hypothetical protein Skr01_31180 [Sphaerisporangium krabiense]